MSTRDTLLLFSEWLDTQGLLRAPDDDERTHQDLADLFLAHRAMVEPGQILVGEHHKFEIHQRVRFTKEALATKFAYNIRAPKGVFYVMYYAHGGDVGLASSLDVTSYLGIWGDTWLEPAEENS